MIFLSSTRVAVPISSSPNGHRLTPRSSRQLRQWAKLLEVVEKPHGTEVKLHDCRKDSAHNLNSIPTGSSTQLEVGSAFHPSEINKVLKYPVCR